MRPCGSNRLTKIAKTLIQRGNKQVELGDFFGVTGSAAEDNTIVWEGDCSRVKLIATEFSEGTVRVVGDAGMHAGAEMTGGELIIEGNAADCWEPNCTAVESRFLVTRVT